MLFRSYPESKIRKVQNLLRAPKEDLQYFNILNYIEIIALFQKYRITLKCRISKIFAIFQYIEYIALDGPISKI